MRLRLTQRISYLEAHHRLGLSLCAGVAGVGATLGRLRPQLQLIAGWDAFALCFLALAWIRVLASQPHVVVRTARLQHSSRRLIFLFVLGGAVASLGAVVGLLGTARELSGAARSQHVLVAVGTVAISWLLVHTIFALFYAYLFYCKPHAGSGAREGGLEFPGSAQPDYVDFAYFSFVIGMSSQVSDVQIRSRQIRKWALLHGLVSFAFNAAILALSINVLSGLF
jgi:uncharacterized membrane protein